MQHNEDYVLGVLQEGGLLTHKQIDSARSRLNGELGVLDVLINDGMKASGGVNGFNPTFDLWSVADGAAGIDQIKWIKNW